MCRSHSNRKESADTECVIISVTD